MLFTSHFSFSDNVFEMLLSHARQNADWFRREGEKVEPIIVETKHNSIIEVWGVYIFFYTPRYFDTPTATDVISHKKCIKMPLKL